ncbi:hypothetical protein FOZ62_026063, partial [Perkinsus olseni]
MNNLDLSSAIRSYKHAVLAYLNFGYWSKIVPAAQKALKKPHAEDMENALTAGLLAVDYFAWSKQSHQGKEMLTIVKRLVDDNGCACPEYISSLLKAYQSCITMSDYETAFGHFYRSWEAGPDVDDLFPLKRAQVMALKCGRSDLVYDAIAEIYKNRGSCLSTIPFLSAMVSFGLEQIGDYEAAERVARDGYACQGAATDDIWLDHAVIHSLYFQGPERQPDALDFFRDHHESWNARQECLIPFIYTHCFWHWALVLAETDQFDEA